MIRQAFKKSLWIFSGYFVMQMAHADHLVECPSVSTLSTYTYGVALPYAYDKQEKSVRFIGVMTEPAEENQRSRFGLVVYPVPVAFSEDPENKIRTLMNQFVSETPNPVNYRIADHMDLPMCIYSLPGKDTLTAFLFVDDGEDIGGNESHLKPSSTKMSPHEHAMKFMKFVKTPF